jgi:hypothetical protein
MRFTTRLSLVTKLFTPPAGRAAAPQTLGGTARRPLADESPVGCL